MPLERAKGFWALTLLFASHSSQYVAPQFEIQKLLAEDVPGVASAKMSFQCMYCRGEECAGDVECDGGSLNLSCKFRLQVKEYVVTAK